MDCDVLDTIENGYIEYSDGTVYQSVATYNCHNGHNLAMSGDEMRTCGSDGMWNGTAPMCDSESKFYDMGLLCLLQHIHSFIYDVIHVCTKVHSDSIIQLL